ncbi:MAG: MFS transporter [Dehalococcoidia bacterium]
MHRTIAALHDWRVAILLGVATIGAYGTASYAIGVLIAPIALDTGWTTASLSAAFSIGILGSGVVAIGVGRALDRVGSRLPGLVTLVAGAALLFLATGLTEPVPFALAWGGGSAIIGGGWFYQATMPATARSYPVRRAEAFQVLTLLGALASPIFYPLGGVLIETLGWRAAAQVLVALMVALMLPAALLVDAPPAPTDATGARPRPDLRAALRRPAVWRAMLTIALLIGASNAIVLHQVPALQAAGLTLAAASGYGGARGLMQAPARLALTPLTRRLGVPGSLYVSYGMGALGLAALLTAVVAGGTAVLAVVFALACGVSIGLHSPLHGLWVIEVYGEDQLGTLSGVQQAVVSVCGAAAPLAAGWLVDASGGYAVPLASMLALQGLAIASLTWQRRATRAPAAPAAPEPAPGR